MNLYKSVVATACFAGATIAAGGSASLAAAPSSALALIALSSVVGLVIGDTLLFLGLVLAGARPTVMLHALAPVFTLLMAVALGLRLPEPLAMAGTILTTAGVLLVVSAREPTGAASRPHRALGFAAALGAGVCQAGGILLAKEGLAHLGSLEAAGVRMGVAALALGISVVATGRGREVLALAGRPRPLAAMTAASLIGTTGGVFLMTYGIKHAHPAIAAALTSCVPLFALPLAALFLEERSGPLAYAGALLAVAGIALIR